MERELLLIHLGEKIDSWLEELGNSKKLREENDIDQDAINWGDLCCVEVSNSLIETVYPQPDKEAYINVVISEASPGSQYLIKYLYEKILKEFPDIGDIRIQTEW